MVRKEDIIALLLRDASRIDNPDVEIRKMRLPRAPRSARRL